MRANEIRRVSLILGDVAVNPKTVLRVSMFGERPRPVLGWPLPAMQWRREISVGVSPCATKRDIRDAVSLQEGLDTCYTRRVPLRAALSMDGKTWEATLVIDAVNGKNHAPKPRIVGGLNEPRFELVDEFVVVADVVP